MDRRSFLATLGAALPAAAARASGAGRGRVVVAGGGVAGVSFALRLKRLAPEAAITLVEPSAHFVFGAATLDYVFGYVPREAVVRGYEALAARGIEILRAAVTGLDPGAGRLRTELGTIAYRYLVLTTGIRAATEEVAGLEEAGTENAGFYERSQLDALRARIAAFAGGTVLVAIPPPPHSCPPAAYELALLFAERLRARRLPGRVLILDANPQPQPAPLAAALDAALQGAGERIERVPAVRIARVEAREKRVLSTDGESFAYDHLAVIPPHRAARFIAEAGLAEAGDAFAEVDPLTFRSARHETIYALGDAARTPYARSAQAAREQALRCASVVARELGAQPAPPAREFEAPCYPYVDSGRALGLHLGYRVQGQEVEPWVKAETEPRPALVQARRAWQEHLLSEVFAT